MERRQKKPEIVNPPDHERELCMNKNGPDQQLADLIKHNGRQVAKICSQKSQKLPVNGPGNSKNASNTFDESYIGISVDRKKVYLHKE